MTQLYVDSDRYGEPPANLLLETVRNAVTDLLRRKLAESGGNWSEFVFSASDRLITAEDFRAIERQILDSGYRFAWSAVISARERPAIYREGGTPGANLASFSFEHPEAVVAVADDAGREQRGIGDNVVRRPENVVGIARYVRYSEQVIGYMNSGVPADTIAIIDDSGGTLTAPIRSPRSAPPSPCRSPKPRRRSTCTKASRSARPALRTLLAIIFAANAMS